MRNTLSLFALVLPAVFLSGCGGGATSSGPALPNPTATPIATGTPQPVPTVNGAIRVACVGDSITAGIGVSNPATNSYPAVLGRWLGDDYQVVNFGVGRTTVLNSVAVSYQKQKSFSQALQFKPSILVVALGTNDSNYTFSSDTKINFENDYTSLVTAFQGANPAVKVYLCLPVPSYPAEKRQNVTLSTEILPLIRQLAQTNKATVIDLNTALSRHSELFPDGVHPNASGAKVIASEVFTAITSKRAPS